MDAGPSMIDNNKEDDDVAAMEQLPPGFRFHPTDEEVIMHYLLNKVMDRRFRSIAIGQADLNKCEPWDLPKKAKMGEKEWFFFWQRDRKYPTGMRTNRATESGYWKATGKDKEIYKGGGSSRNNSSSCLVGMKKTLVFYKGRAPKGVKTNWVMHEFRLEGNFSNYNFSRVAKEEWVVSKIFHKSTGIRRGPGVEPARINSFMEHLLDSPTTLPPLADYSNEIRANSTFAPPDHEQESNTSITPSRFTMNNPYLQMQNDQKTFFQVPPQNYYNLINGNNIFPSQMALPNYQGSSSSLPLGYHHQYALTSMIEGSGYPTNFPFKGGDHQANLRFMASNIPTKMEPFSTNNSMVSHSQDTGLSTDQTAVANEITSVHSKGDIESKKPFDQELEGISFSPNISDLDSLWSY